MITIFKLTNKKEISKKKIIYKINFVDENNRLCENRD